VATTVLSCANVAASDMQGSVIFSISSVQDVHPISPLIYGVIQVNLATSPTYSLKISFSTSQHSITQLLGRAPANFKMSIVSSHSVLCPNTVLALIGRIAGDIYNDGRLWTSTVIARKI